MNYKELTELLKTKKVSIKELTKQIGITRQGLQFALDNETLPLRQLKSICNTLRIAPAVFFDAGTFGVSIQAGGNVQSGNNNKMIIESKEREISLLKQQIADKNEIINLLKSK